MRYVGRHRAPRPLYLRRPVVAGAVAVVALGGPALAVTQGLNGDGERNVSAAGQSTALPTPSSTDGTTIVIPTDDAVVPTLTAGPTTAPGTSGGGSTGGSG